MARRPPPKGAPPGGSLGSLRHRLGKQPRPGEGQWIVGSYAVVSVVLLLAPFVTTEVPNPTGATAPDFSLPTTTGATYHLDPTNLGRPVMLEFMHPMCSHCQAMTDTLDSAHSAYGGQVDFVSVAIPLGSLGQPTMDDVRAFKDNYGHTWTYCLASNNDVAIAYGVSGTPTFFFINANGTVASTQSGEIPFDVLASNLQGIMGG